MTIDIDAAFNRIFPDPKTEQAHRGGAAARRLGIPIDRNAYVDGTALQAAAPLYAAECAAKHAAWRTGWLEADTELVLKKLAQTVPEVRRQLEEEPMPWCERCGSYHHHTARHIR